MTAGELVELGRELRHQLQEARQNLTNLKTECDANIAAKNKGVCDKIAGGEALHAGADFTQVRWPITAQHRREQNRTARNG